MNKNKILNLVGIRHFFYALLITVIFYGCNDTENKKVEKIDNINIKEGYTIYIIDSCEYIGTSCIFSKDSYSHNPFLTHKGNCKFCAERKKN